MIHKVLCSILATVIVFPLPLRAGNEETHPASLVISQVQVSGASSANDEFIELHNFSSEPLSLAGWSVQYKTATGTFPLTSKKNLAEFILQPGQFYLVPHADYAGLVEPDLRQSAFSFSGSAAGATIFLSRSTDPLASADDPDIVGKVAYGSGSGNVPEGAGAPLPEPGKSLFRISYTGDNSVDFEIRDAMPRNSSHAPEAPSNENPSDEEEDPENEGPEPEDEEEPSHPAGIIISEIMANPEGADGGEEWVELYNSSNAPVNLKDWILIDSSINGAASASAYKIPDITLAAGAYKAIPVPEGKFSLNNSGMDSVRMFWPDQTLAYETSYSGPVKDEQTWCRISSGYEWCQATPNSSNAKLSKEDKEEDDKEESKEEEDDKDDDDDEDTDYMSAEIRIVEIMPDPEGSDSGHEYIKLSNAGTETVNVEDWILDDGEISDPIGSTALVLDKNLIDPGNELEMEIPSGRFALNNSGSDTVRLFAPDKKLKDSVFYEDAKEGIAYSKSGGSWEWRDQDAALKADGQVAGEDLPRTGMPPAAFGLIFATLPLFWYIGVAFRRNQSTNEQARSYRRAGGQAGEQSR